MDATVTIKTIAEKCGVAKSTVSRVLNNSGYVGKETREKIENVMREYNYSPSAMARNLSKQESNAVGVVIPEADNAFFGEVLRGISDVVDENDLTLLFCNTCNDLNKELNALKMLRNQRVRGLILTPAAEYDTKERIKNLRQALKAINVPIIILDRTIENSEWDSVSFDNYHGAYLATQTLINAGHKKIGVITGDQGLHIGRERYRGYLQAMSDHNIEHNSDYIYKGDFTSSTAYEITKKMLANGDYPDAIFLSNNLTAIGFFKAFFEAGLEFGKDICCIGFDRVEALDLFNLNYSYVERDAVNMGRIAMNMLLDRIKNPKGSMLTRREYIIPANLVLKGSEYRKL